MDDGGGPVSSALSETAAVVEADLSFPPGIMNCVDGLEPRRPATDVFFVDDAAVGHL